MITVVLGGEYGSEGKGSIVSWLAKNNAYDLVIRTGGTNAGHTFKGRNGELFKMRQLPCSWAFQNTPIYIPAGAVVDLDILEKEAKLVRENGYTGQIHVSPYSAVISSENRNAEEEIETGTTGAGVGATRAKKCLRKAELVKDFYEAVGFTNSQVQVQHLLKSKIKNILIEATQGYGLSLDGSRYPYVTSANLDTYRILSDAEIPFGVHQVQVWLVLRAFPIRIAGNSGYLFNETSWAELRKAYGEHIPDEQTTVTKKTRRVGEFDPTLAKEAVVRCGANVIVLTFVDYVFPNVKETGVTAEIDHWLCHLEGKAGLHFDYLGIGTGELVPRLYSR